MSNYENNHGVIGEDGRGDGRDVDWGERVSSRPVNMFRLTAVDIGRCSRTRFQLWEALQAPQSVVMMLDRSIFFKSYGVPTILGIGFL